MNADILKKLEQRVDRRSFLRGSGLAAAAVVAVAAFPLASAAQDQGTDKPAEPKKDDKPAETGKAPENGKDEAAKDKKEEPKDAKDTKDTAPDPFKETKKDAAGRDYRLCPQCGYNMYKQDKTWSCENCGYSYVE
jgi:rubrerythrin